MRFKDWAGTIVVLPYFDLSDASFTDSDEDGNAIWSDKAIRFSKAIKKDLVVIDKALRTNSAGTPPPDWLDGQDKPAAVTKIAGEIEKVEARIADLKGELATKISEKETLNSLSHLLYENGARLEDAIERVLKMMGFEVSSLRIDDLEIDHIFVSPEGERLIGEAEGKDNSAIDIKKFRQLESNIGEDFERDEVEDHAKGVLFGNGYRLTDPAERAEQFTKKCLKNAERLGSALIRTSDLYPVAVYLQDNPNDEPFMKACREAIVSTGGGVVSFPSLP